MTFKITNKYRDVEQIRIDIQNWGIEFGNTFVTIMTNHETNFECIRECIITAQYVVGLIADGETENLFEIANTKARKLLEDNPYFLTKGNDQLTDEQIEHMEQQQTLKSQIFESYKLLILDSDPPMSRIEFVKYLTNIFDISQNSAHTWTYHCQREFDTYNNDV